MADGTPQDSTEPGVLDDVVRKARGRAQERLRRLRAERPDDDRRALADRLVTSFSRRAGLGGAATGALSLVSLPIGLPAGIALTMAIEAELLLSLMALYDVDSDGEQGRVKLFALWAGSGVADALKNAGLSAGAGALARFVAGTLPVKLIGKLNPVLVRLVMRRLGLGWLPRVFKFWPVVGAPIGYLIDSSAARTLGQLTVATLEEAERERRQPKPPDVLIS